MAALQTWVGCWKSSCLAAFICGMGTIASTLWLWRRSGRRCAPDVCKGPSYSRYSSGGRCIQESNLYSQATRPVIQPPHKSTPLPPLMHRACSSERNQESSEAGHLNEASESLQGQRAFPKKFSRSWLGLACWLAGREGEDLGSSAFSFSLCIVFSFCVFVFLPLLRD